MNLSFALQVLRRCKGTVELVDVSTELPQLARRPGIKKWRVGTLRTIPFVVPFAMS